MSMSYEWAPLELRSLNTAMQQFWLTMSQLCLGICCDDLEVFAELAPFSNLFI